MVKVSSACEILGFKSGLAAVTLLEALLKLLPQIRLTIPPFLEEALRQIQWRLNLSCIPPPTDGRLPIFPPVFFHGTCS